MKISSVEAFIIDVPQKHPAFPYQSRYIATSSTGALLIRLETDDGLVGWGETPQILSFYGDKPFTAEVVESLRPELMGRDAGAIEALYEDWDLGGPRLQSAVEMAMWDILGKACGQPLYRLWGGPYRDRIELAACMGIQPPDKAGEIARGYLEAGFTTMKTKAGRSPEEDLAMVKGIRDAVGDRLKLRIDPNTGYTPEVTEQLAKELEPYHLEYFEQPMPDENLEDSARIRKLTSTPLALNESVTTMSRVREILDCEAADYLLPDTYQCGGLWAVKLIVDIASSAGVPCIFHCAHDFGLKTAAMLHVAASSPNMPLANDCTYYALESDILKTPHQITSGRMPVPEAPGLGVEVDLSLVQKYQVSR
ncbi:MAG: mandelate racemase/muconate lactonizing enzyme family protein [Planctomycetaceae bacterium]|nr:mandelate racemase/muconate lactonizing enzyme family protein [Planctomycetaceae bacterium]